MPLRLGRPLNTDGRLQKEIHTYDYLDALHIPYQSLDHTPAYTMEDCRKTDEQLGTRMCKNLLLCNRQKTDFYLLLMPDDKPFKTKELSHQLNCSRLSFADGEFMEKFLNISPGALSILGLMNDTKKRVQLLVDQDLIKCEYIGCHPCVNTSSLKIASKDLFTVFLKSCGHTLIPVVLTGEA